MKKFHSNCICYYLLFSLIFAFFSCEELEMIDFPQVETGEFTNTGVNFIEVSANVGGLLPDSFLDAYGHIWSTEPNVNSSNREGQTSSTNKIGNGIFSSEITGLTPGETYYYKAYIVFNGEEYLGEERSFTIVENFVEDIIQGMSLEILSVNFGDELTKLKLTFNNLPKGLEIKSFGLTWGGDSLPTIDRDRFLPYEGQTVLESNKAIEVRPSIPLLVGKNYIRPFMVIGDSAIYARIREEAVIGDIWVSKADFAGGGTDDAASFSIRNKAYVLKQSSSNNFWEFDPIAGELDPITGVYSGAWTKKSDFPGAPRGDAIGLSIEVEKGVWRGYMGAGRNRVDFYEYNPETDSWKPMEDFRGGKREFPVGFVIGNKAYVGAGQTAADIPLCPDYPAGNNFWEFDPSVGEKGKWNRKANIEECRFKSFAVGFAVGNRGYIAGGQARYVYEYDPSFDTWRKLNASTPGRIQKYIVAFTIDSTAYLGTGVDDVFQSGGVVDEFWKFEPYQNYKWTQLKAFGGEPRFHATGFAIEVEPGIWRGYIGTGDSSLGPRFSDFWEYFPEN